MAPFQHVARAAAGYQVAWVFSALVSSWMKEIYRHNQRVLETSHPVQSAILTHEVIALQNQQSLVPGQGPGNKRQGSEVHQHFEHLHI